MKVFTLALDGLEYNLVKKWSLKHLMQKKYDKILLSPRYQHPDAKVPWTPYIWASFISGTPTYIRISFTYGRILNKIRTLPFVNWVKGKRRILWKVGLTPRVVQSGKPTETIFDKVRPSIAIDVPTYNEPLETWKIHEVLWTKGVKEYVKEIWKLYESRKTRTFQNLSKDWKFFMAYFRIADFLGHMYITKSPKTLQRVYKTLDDLTFKLKRTIPEDTIFLIVSDHGIKPEPDGTGNHSNHAFYSLNIKTDWRPKDIIDFHPKILEWVKI